MTPSQLILKALNQTPEQMQELQKAQGITFLKRFTLNVDEFAEVAFESPVFQKYWKTQWQLRDANFVYQTNLYELKLPLDLYSLLYVVDLYLMAHSPKDLKITLSAPVVDDITRILTNYKLNLEKGQSNVD